MMRPHPGSSGGYWGQQGDIEAASTHAGLPGVVAPAQHQLVFLDRHDDRLPPAVFDVLVPNDEIANGNGLPARRAGGGIAVAVRAPTGPASSQSLLKTSGSTTGAKVWSAA